MLKYNKIFLVIIMLVSCQNSKGRDEPIVTLDIMSTETEVFAGWKDNFDRHFYAEFIITIPWLSRPIDISDKRRDFIELLTLLSEEQPMGRSSQLM